MKKKKLTPGKIVFWMVLIVVAVIQILSLTRFSDFSLASSNEMFTSGLLIILEVIKWDNYVKAFVDGHFLLYFKNSLLINVLAAIVVLVISIMAFFACTRMHWKLSGVVRNLVLLGMMILTYTTPLSNYVVYDKLHLTDSIQALLIPYTVFSLPQGPSLTSSFMDSTPKEIEEAAMIDGRGIYQMITISITPMLKSPLVTVLIMTFLNNWNEFMMVSTYLSSPKWETLPFSVPGFTGMYSSNYAVQFAVMTLTAAPMVIIYIILNKYIAKGAAIGAVKG